MRSSQPAIMGSWRKRCSAAFWNSSGLRGLEVVLTGRDPSPALCAMADYITEMKKQKHPYDTGVLARRGIEF